MSRYDGLIIPRSYSEYINKTDAATLQQALQLSGVLSGTVAAGDNKAVTSNAVNCALAEYINKTDAATLQQALQLSGVLSEAVAAGDNKAVTSNAVNCALAEYINKTDAATLQQALQLSGVLSEAVAAGDNKAVKSGAVATALANTVRLAFNSFSNNGRIITFTLEPNASSCYECLVYFYGGLLGVYSLTRDVLGLNGANIKTLWEVPPKMYSITVDETTGIVTMAGTGADNIIFKIYKL